MKNYCLGCMTERKSGEQVCPVCGWNHYKSRSPNYALVPGSFLHEGKYLVGKVLGRGGFGITYIGFDLALEIRVAIKEYFPQSMVSRTTNSSSMIWHTTEEQKEKGRESFIKEARNMAKIKKIPNVSQVLDVFYQNNTAYIIMDYVDGETLRSRVKSQGVLTDKECFDIFKPVMESLSAAHNIGLIHRDISPDNIMIEKDGKVWLMDMGAAKEMDSKRDGDYIAEQTQLVVHRGFSPLEQFSDSGRIGPWTDVYALAATVYYAMTGKVPPEALSRLDGDKGNDVTAGLPDNMKNVIEKGLSLLPEKRYQSVEEFQNAWKEAITPAQKKVDPPKKKSFISFIKSHKIACAAVIVVLLLIPMFVKFFSSPDLEAEVLGTSNANLMNYGGWVTIGENYEYFISADDGLYEAEKDQESGIFYLGDAKRLCDDGLFLTTDGSSIYFISNAINESESGIYKWNPEEQEIEFITGDPEDKKRELESLQYVKLNNNKEYLYYLIKNNDTTFSIARYDMKEGSSTTLAESNVMWYNVYKDSIYYTADDEETGNSTLFRANLSGEKPKELNSDKMLLYGFVEDDILFMYSKNEDTIMEYNLDGTPNEECPGFYNADMDMNRFCYEKGWIYYCNSKDNSIHRIRANGTGDEVEVKDHISIAMCCYDSLIWFIEDSKTDQEHLISRQVNITYHGDEEVMKINDPEMEWDLSPANSTDFQYADNPDGEGILVTGYTGGEKFFRIPKFIDGKKVTGVGDEAFKDSNVEEIGLPKTAVSIGKEAFYGCKNLTFIGILEGTKNIKDQAFGDCSGLKKVTFPSTLETIGELAFAETNLESVHIPASVKEIGAGCFVMPKDSGFKKIEVDENNKLFYSTDLGALYKIETSGDQKHITLLQLPSGYEESYYGMKNINAISKYALAHCSKLTTLSIPDTVMEIGELAFFDSGVNEITINRLCKVPDNLGKEITVKYYQ